METDMLIALAQLNSQHMQSAETCEQHARCHATLATFPHLERRYHLELSFFWVAAWLAQA